MPTHGQAEVLTAQNGQWRVDETYVPLCWIQTHISIGSILIAVHMGCKAMHKYHEYCKWHEWFDAELIKTLIIIFGCFNVSSVKGVEENITVSVWLSTDLQCSVTTVLQIDLKLCGTFTANNFIDFPKSLMQMRGNRKVITNKYGPYVENNEPQLMPAFVAESQWSHSWCHNL